VVDRVSSRNVAGELPFMATESLLMAAVQAGGDRQALHERIRVHAMAAAERLKAGAADNDLIDRIGTDPAFPALDFDRVLDPSQFIAWFWGHQLASVASASGDTISASDLLLGTPYMIIVESYE